MSRRRNRPAAAPDGDGGPLSGPAPDDVREVYAWALWKTVGEGHHFRRVRLPLDLVLEQAETHDAPDQLSVTLAKCTRDMDRLAFKDEL